MNKNQKIALGCGGAGCLGLIVLVVAGGLVWFFMVQSATGNRNYNFNTNSNRSTNRNSGSTTNSAEPTSSSSSSMSDDDKHKLFQAASATGDSALLQRALKKMGLFDASGMPTDEYTSFAKDHFSWALKNAEFIRSVSTPEAARAYVEEHLNE